MPTIHLLIRGKVQGVFYRASAKKIADQLGLNGWIKNSSNGDVEALVTGSATQLKQFTEWCREGPDRAEVEEIIETAQEEIVLNSFSVKR
jgi:acylphosphatase